MNTSVDNLICYSRADDLCLQVANCLPDLLYVSCHLQSILLCLSLFRSDITFWSTALVCHHQANTLEIDYRFASKALQKPWWNYLGI